MLPSTIKLPGPFDLLVPFAHAEEMGMLLDLEGHLIVGGRFLSRSAELLRNDGSTTTRADDLSELFLSASHSTLWERDAARLCQRICEVQTLIEEDLREIEEPMSTLGTIALSLSHEYVVQWEAAKTAYTQAFQECTDMLAHILSPLLEQRGEPADGIPSQREAVCR